MRNGLPSVVELLQYAAHALRMDVNQIVARLVERAGLCFAVAALRQHLVVVQHLANGGPTDHLDQFALARVRVFA